MPQVIRAKMPPISEHQTKQVDLTTNNISQVIHDFKMCASIKQAKQLKPL